MTAEAISETEASYYLGDLLLHNNRLLQAEPYLRKTLALEPGHANARASLGLLRLRQNRVAEARAELEKAVQNGKVRPAARYFYVRSLMQPEAEGTVTCCDPKTREIILAQLRTVIEQMPSFAQAYNLLGYMNLTADSDLEEAIDLVKRGLALQPRRREFLLTLGQLQLKKQDLTASRATLEALLAGTRDERLQSIARDLLRHIAEVELFMEQEAQSSQQTQDASKPAGIIRRRAAGEQPGNDVRGETGPATQLETVPAVTQSAYAGPAPGISVTREPECNPTFVDVRGHFRLAGTLVRVDTGGLLAFVLRAGGKEYNFLAPKTGTPLIFSCRVELGNDFDYTDLHHSAIVYFYPVPDQPELSGKAVAIEILATQPAPE